VYVYRGSAIGHQIWPSSVKWGRYRSPQNVKICQKLWFWPWKPTQWTHSDEIWPVSVYLGCALAQQIWPSSVKGGRYRRPQNVKICQKLWFWPWKPTQWTHSDEIWRDSVDLGSVLAHQIWPSSVKGWVQESPKYQKLRKIMVFGHRKPIQWTLLLRAALRDTALCTLTHHLLACRPTSHLIDWRESYDCLTHERELYVGL